jgi:prepilin-type N-terminal cleavage/methylation domain-containing protein
MKSRGSARNAFTLIELLVAMALVAVAAAVLLPGGSRKPGYVRCMNNLRQIGVAFQMYATDWSHDTAGNTNSFHSPFFNWTDYRLRLAPYLAVKGAPSPTNQLFTCPKDTFFYESNGRRGVAKPFHEQAKFNFTSYAFNAGQVTTASPTTNRGLAGMNWQSAAHPARTVLIAEVPAYAPYSWHYPKESAFRDYSKFNDARNVLGFVDGHVSVIQIYYDGKKPAWDYNPPATYDYQWSGD